MEVFGLQWNLAWENRSANFEHVRSVLESRRPPRGSLVVLPEMFSSGFSMNVPAIAEGADRPAERFLGEVAKEYGVYATGGVVHQGGEGKGLNQAVSFSPEGVCADRYTKMHPFLKTKEGRFYHAGDTVTTWSWEGAVVCPAICYDLRFPEYFRAGSLLGAEVFVVIACWPAARREHWRALLRARAIENQACVVGVNRCGADPYLEYPGLSVVYDYFGNTLAEADEGEATIRASLDLGSLRAFRKELPVLEERRPDLSPAPSFSRRKKTQESPAS